MTKFLLLVKMVIFELDIEKLIHYNPTILKLLVGSCSAMFKELQISFVISVSSAS